MSKNPEETVKVARHCGLHSVEHTLAVKAFALQRELLKHRETLCEELQYSPQKSEEHDAKIRDRILAIDGLSYPITVFCKEMSHG